MLQYHLKNHCFVPSQNNFVTQIWVASNRLRNPTLRCYVTFISADSFKSFLYSIKTLNVSYYEQMKKMEATTIERL